MFVMLPSVNPIAVLSPKVRSKSSMLLLRLIQNKSTKARTCAGASLYNLCKNNSVVWPREDVWTLKPFDTTQSYHSFTSEVRLIRDAQKDEKTGKYPEFMTENGGINVRKAKFMTYQPFNASQPSCCVNSDVAKLKKYAVKGENGGSKAEFLTFMPLKTSQPFRSFNSSARTNKHDDGDADKGERSGTETEFMSHGTKSTLYYIAAVGVLAFGLSYAAVPLYRIFCQAYSYGGTTQAGHDAAKVETMDSVKNRVIRIRFNADIAASMTWNFRPQQSEIKVHPGETALAFYTAKNPTDRPVIGVSTYNVVPFDAGQYFNKIQCFCFEEQMLNPHEQVDMPVFFYIDPEFDDDPKMHNVDLITLSYTFFEAREGLQLPMPQFSR